MKTLFGIILFLTFFFTSLHSDESWKIYEADDVATIEITVEPEALDWMYQNVWSDSMHVASVHFSNAYINETIQDVGFRLRGNTSRIAQKKSFKLSYNTFVPGRQFYDVDKINLNGEHNDPSIIRSKICWDNYGLIGQKSSRASYAAVYVNDEYYGLYISVEHIDDEFLSKNFADDSGNLWKCHYPARLTFLGSNPELYKLEQNGRRIYELKTNTEDDDYSQLARLIDVINNTNSADIADSLETMINAQSVLKYLAADVLTGSWDDYWYGKSNYYIYHEPTEDRFYVIPFDYDNTFGVDWQGIDWTERDIYVFKHPDADRPLADRFLEIQEYKNLYSHFLEFYRNNAFELTNLETNIDNIKSMITDYAEADVYRTLDYGFTISDFHNSYTDQHYENQHVKRGLKEFINLRNTNLDQQIEYEYSGPIIYIADYYPKAPAMQDTIYINASVFNNNPLQSVSIEFFAEDDEQPIEFEMTYTPTAGTYLVEENDNYEGSVPFPEDVIYGSFRIKAVTENGITAYYPNTANILIEPVTSGIMEVAVNEVLAKNESVNQDSAGDYDDWLELYNYTSEQINLTGAFLTDNEDNLTKWEFPYGSIIYPGDFMLIWCDEDQGQGPYHTNFKLSGQGEFVGLVHPNGSTIIDSFTFPEQSYDISYGRTPDGGSEFGFMQPTPDGANNPADVEDNIQYSIENIKLYNYPNPFNPETTIYFSISIEPNQQISINIYNIKGQIVDILPVSLSGVEGVTNDSASRPSTTLRMTQAGSVIWDASKYSSGIYLFKFSIANSPIKKMILLK